MNRRPAKERTRAVLITGGTGSVGRALVRAFCEAGDTVVFQFGSDAATARRLAVRFSAQPLQINLAGTFQLPKVDFDVVINNAGINITDKPTHRVSRRDWELTLAVNLTAPFEVLRQCLPGMVRRRWGRIINVSSIYGLRAVASNLPYTVSKHGLAGITKTVAKEYARFGITCNEICAGPIESRMMLEIARRSTTGTAGAVRAYLREVANEIPARRLLRPRELADLALFLASDAAAYVNGVSIPQDGGLVA